VLSLAATALCCSNDWQATVLALATMEYSGAA
jgi:hypothetical protein